MELFNLLEKAIPVFGQTFDVSLGWIGFLVSLIISGVSVVGLGVILFSLILKLIVLPFDIYQRIAMRKQNIKMEEQKERMEKLQKQYANDQNMYNQKVMEMYKENGISMFSSCLPMIMSILIFMGAIGGFNEYSQYSAIQNYNTMVEAYNAKIESYCPDLTTATPEFVDGKIVVKGGAEDYIFYRVSAGNYTQASDMAEVKAYIQNATDKEYIIDAEKVQASSTLMAELQPSISAGTSLEDAAYNYFIGEAQTAVLEVYEGTVSKNTEFLWIKNIWATDAYYVHPVLSYSEFESKGTAQKFDVNGEEVSYGDIGAKTGTRVYSEDAYNLITGKLTAHKEAPNGYFILIALSIVTIILQQLISMRSQKAQNKYSTVDGQGASQQKMTLVIMTVMFAGFSFYYSSAFSIYMIVSSVFSLISTLIINKFVDMYMAKQSTKEEVVRLDNRRLSRIEAARKAGKESAKESRDKKADKEDKRE